jgi:hypothetical protein
MWRLALLILLGGCGYRHIGAFSNHKTQTVTLQDGDTLTPTQHVIIVCGDDEGAPPIALGAIPISTTNMNAGTLIYLLASQVAGCDAVPFADTATTETPGGAAISLAAPGSPGHVVLTAFWTGTRWLIWGE